mmetsp:Transcript_27169/g.89078  ORF Transcript_27169/g.89078 Transcript_27169/m.89078 type:complete len:349 (-) Transcript_27169:181-1227(-)
MALPTIDATPLLLGTDTGAASEELTRALCERGFAYVTLRDGAGEELEATASSLFVEARGFFAEPEATKRKCDMRKAGRAWRGFFGVGDELTSGKPDLKEGLYFGLDTEPGRLMHGSNLWPEGHPKLRVAVEAYMKSMNDFGFALMRGLAVGLGQAPDYFEESFSPSPHALFRIFRYPADPTGSQERGETFGVGRHTDYGALTLLKLEDGAQGLEVEDRLSGEFVPVPSVPKTWVVNVGDALQVVTGNRLRATPHRVRMPASAEDRLSAPYFFDPAFDAALRPMPGVELPSAEGDGVGFDGSVFARLAREASASGGAVVWGDYVTAKIGKVFPELAAEAHANKHNTVPP